MTDQDLRGLLLRSLYDQRAQDWSQIGMSGRNDPEQKERIRIARQLAEYGLIEFKMLNPHLGGLARIAAAGVDVIEGTVPSPISMTIDERQTINISESSQFQVGDGNVQSIENSIAILVRAIERSEGTPEQKKEAKNLLKKFLEHPLVAAIAGGLTGLLGG